MRRVKKPIKEFFSCVLCTRVPKNQERSFPNALGKRARIFGIRGSVPNGMRFPAGGGIPNGESRGACARD